MNDMTMTRGARFSVGRTHRYALWRHWDNAKPSCMFIGLNPSTADEKTDDPTIRRCVGFSGSWGYGGIWMLNLFGYRTKDPRELFKVSHPIGDENDEELRAFGKAAQLIVAAWGAGGSLMNRDMAVREMLPTVSIYCLGLTKAGQPRHPLYIPADTPLSVWRHPTT